MKVTHLLRTTARDMSAEHIEAVFWRFTVEPTAGRCSQFFDHSHVLE